MLIFTSQICSHSQPLLGTHLAVTEPTRNYQWLNTCPHTTHISPEDSCQRGLHYSQWSHVTSCIRGNHPLQEKRQMHFTNYGLMVTCCLTSSFKWEDYSSTGCCAFSFFKGYIPHISSFPHKCLDWWTKSNTAMSLGPPGVAIFSWDSQH